MLRSLKSMPGSPQGYEIPLLQVPLLVAPAVCYVCFCHPPTQACGSAAVDGPAVAANGAEVVAALLQLLL